MPSPAAPARTRTPEAKTPPRRSEVTEDLHVTVESALELLPAQGRDTCDAFVTVRADPLEKKNGRRTAIKHSTRDPVRGRTGRRRARRTRARATRRDGESAPAGLTSR